MMAKINMFNSEVKQYTPSYKGKMLLSATGKYVRLVDYHRLKLQCKPLDEENQKLFDDIYELEEAFAEMKVDYNKRRSQAKRYQKSAKRRHKYVEILENENAKLKNEVFQWQNNHDEQVRRKTVCRETLEAKLNDLPSP